MNSKFINEFKSKISLNEEQKEILIGLMLGDGCLESENKGLTYRLKVEQSLLHKDYVDWMYGKFRNLVLTRPKERIKRIKEKTYKNYGFQTVSCGNLRFFAQQFYGLNGKRVPKIIGKLLSPMALAVWFMDDGQIKSKKHRALLINSQCFSKKDLRLLQKALKDKFKIETTLKKEKRGYRIYLLSETVSVFLETVNPYVLPSMRYKFGRINNLPKR